VVDSQNNLFVVPKEWIFNDNSLVHYPKSGNINALVQFGAEPDDDWDIVQIDVLKNNIGNIVYFF